MNRNKVITELYDHPDLVKCAKRIKTDGVLEWRDLLTSAVMKLMELSDEQFKNIGNYRGYVYGIMRHMNNNPYEQFNKLDRFTGAELIDERTELTETHTEEPNYTYDEFAKFCFKASESNGSEAVKLAQANEEFAFKVVDAAYPAKSPSNPSTVLVGLCAGLLGFSLSAVIVLITGRRRTRPTV